MAWINNLYNAIFENATYKEKYLLKSFKFGNLYSAPPTSEYHYQLLQNFFGSCTAVDKMILRLLLIHRVLQFEKCSAIFRFTLTIISGADQNYSHIKDQQLCLINSSLPTIYISILLFPVHAEQLMAGFVINLNPDLPDTKPSLKYTSQRTKTLNQGSLFKRTCVNTVTFDNLYLCDKVNVLGCRKTF